MDCTSAPTLDRDSAFIGVLARGGPITGRVAIVVAHPDDESIGAGGQFSRFENLVLVVATDGAPRDGRDVKRLGYAHAEDYARARRAELVDALRAAGFAPQDVLLQLNLRDGGLVFELDILAAQLTHAFGLREIEVVLTHAYEGGHPDHDAVALAVRLAARRSARAPIIVEMPYYRAGSDGWALQAFAEERPAPLRLEIIGEAWLRKCAMIDAHRSQADLLRDFRQPLEFFRVAPEHDFTHLPNGGRLLYHHVAPSLHPEDWLAQARAALAREGLV